MNRRGVFGWIGSALAGCVLANTPLAGKWFEPEPEETVSFSMVFDGTRVLAFVDDRCVSVQDTHNQPPIFATSSLWSIKTKQAT